MGDPPGYLLVHCAQQPAFAPVPLHQPVTYLGRIAGNDVVLPSANVSRRHAKLIVTDMGVTAHDLDSHNGIFLNGTRVRSTPVNVGDRLYIGDVCVQLQRGTSSFDGTGHNTAVVRNELTGDDEPHARALAATLRVAHLSVDGADESWAIDAVQTCRDLVDGTVAALIEIHEDGELDAPIILQPDGQRRDASVLWPLVHKVISSGELVFSRDVVVDGYVDAVGDDGLRAVMAVPVFVGREHTLHAILYLARAAASVVFSELEVEALQAIARLLAMRLDRSSQRQAPPPGETTRIAGSLDIVQHQQQLAALEAQLGAEQEQLQQVTARVHALESDNLRLRQQGDIDRNAALKKDAERERDVLARIEQAAFEGRRQGQRDASTVGREQLQELQSLVDAACSERDALLEASEHHRTELDASLAELEGAKTDLAAARLELETIRGDHEAALHDVATLKLAVVGHESAVSTADQELNRARAELAELQAERTRLQADLVRLEQVDQELQAHLDTSRRDGERQAQAAQQAEVLRSALRTSVLPTVVDHVDAIANGESATTDAHTRAVTAVYVALADFDGWCANADAAVVKRHLDRFCRVVSAQVIAHGGRIEQVVGHGHLLGFAADASGAVAAVHCALDIAHIVDATAATEGDGNAPAVVAGLHVGTSVAGFFGDTTAVSYVEAGLPVIIARAAIDFAPKTHNGASAGVIVSDAVRQSLGSNSGLRITRLDPSWIRGVNAPVQLALVDLDDEQRGAL
jgi:class 3 adenylate cyclase